MAIKGLTDRGLKFPEIGAIRKGSPKTEKAPGKDLTYFRVEFSEGEEEAAEKFREVYGDQPREINIILPFDDIERQWDAYLEGYTAGRLIARSDGERFLYWVDTDGGGVKVLNGEPYIPYSEGMSVGKDYKGQDIVCKPAGRMRVIIPELRRAACLVLMTTSRHDIANISDQLRAIAMLNGGRISGLPLVLKRRPKMISVPIKEGEYKRLAKYMLSIEADPRWVSLKLDEIEQNTLPEAKSNLLLPSDIDVDGVEVDYGEDEEEDVVGVDGEVVAQEDHPGKVEGELVPSERQMDEMRSPVAFGDYRTYYDNTDALGISKEDAHKLVKECANDAQKAWEKVKTTYFQSGLGI